MISDPSDRASRARKAKRRTAFAVSLAAGLMLGAAFASVPLYRLFCQVTGYGGTPQIASEGVSRRGTRTLLVRFDANVAPGLGWRFEPEVAAMTVMPGETVTAFYKVRNISGKRGSAIASYNVSPDQAGRFFNKIACFCFTEQTLEAGQEMDMPVMFFLDPDLDANEVMRGVSEVTLSYTFFPSEAPIARDQAQSQARREKAL